MRYSLAPLNIPTPTPAPDRGGPVAPDLVRLFLNMFGVIWWSQSQEGSVWGAMDTSTKSGNHENENMPDFPKVKSKRSFSGVRMSKLRLPTNSHSANAIGPKIRQTNKACFGIAWFVNIFWGFSWVVVIPKWLICISGHIAILV